ncbi:MAG TPA: gliding motility protein GldL [Bacteroidales bacterium]|nr:gliding motility protein GldL [Bacteroidales bacterium]
MISKIKAFRIRLSIFLGSYRGKTIFNLFYGLGAAVAILGTLFKLLHLDGANIMLSLGLGTEVFIFAISALEPPYRNYHWEHVFPILKTHAEEDRPDFKNLPGGQKTEGMTTEVYVGDTNNVPHHQGHVQSGGVPYTPHRNSMEGVTPEQARENYGIPPQVPISDEDAATLTDSIKKMGEAVSQLNNLADITMVTENYISKLSGMADNLNRFSDATGSLAEVSNVLLDSYRNVTENSDEISANSKGYVEQMGNLNRNLSGLNTIYEIQLKSVSSQIDTIDRVNKGLVHIREMYESSTGDSDRFSKETEAMADNLARLNLVYARMLEAMSPNAIFANMMAGEMNAARSTEKPNKPEETDGKES